MISVNDMRRAKEREKKMKCDVTRREAISRQFHLSRRLLCSMFNHCEMWSGDFVLRPLPQAPASQCWWLWNYDWFILAFKTWARWTTAWLMANDKDFACQLRFMNKSERKKNYNIQWQISSKLMSSAFHLIDHSSHIQQPHMCSSKKKTRTLSIKRNFRWLLTRRLEKSIRLDGVVQLKLEINFVVLASASSSLAHSVLLCCFYHWLRLSFDFFFVFKIRNLAQSVFVEEFFRRVLLFTIYGTRFVCWRSHTVTIGSGTHSRVNWGNHRYLPELG